MIKNILFLIPSMAGVGGTERMVSNLIKLLAEKGYNVTLATFDEPGIDFHFNCECAEFRLGPFRRLPLFFRAITYFLMVRRLSRLKRNLEIDLTISNLWGADFISALSFGGKNLALAHINVVGNATNLMMLKFLPFVAGVYRRFEKIVAVNQGLSLELKDLYKIPESRITYINNFVRPAPEILVPIGERANKFRVVWCGRFVSEKNVGGLLKVWSDFVKTCNFQAQLVLVGSGPLFQEMRDVTESLLLTSSNDLENTTAKVIFAGHSDSPEYILAKAKALLVTSKAEGLPMVILESLALGVPILAADCPSGGVRTALGAESPHNPSRRDSEVTKLGVLLPIPLVDDVNTRTSWVHALETLYNDNDQYLSWCQGALSQYALFSPEAASKRWGEILKELDHP